MKIWVIALLSVLILHINCEFKIPKEYALIFKSQLCKAVIEKLMTNYQSDVDDLIMRTMEIYEELGEKESKNYMAEIMIINCINSMTENQFSLLSDYYKNNIKNFDIKQFENNLKFEELKQMLMDNDTQKLNEYSKLLIKYKDDFNKQLEDFQDAQSPNVLAKKGDAGILGSKFKDNKWMKIIGFVSLSVIVLGLGYLYYKISSMNVKKKKKKR